jgi:hypothetical protein
MDPESPPPLFGVDKVMSPELAPLLVVSPEKIVMSPPAAVSPLPTIMLIDPPLPPTLEPVPTCNSPLSPDEEIPLLNVKCPDTPPAPELADFTTMLPLVVATPWSAISDRKPPVFNVFLPVVTDTCPP